MTEIRRRPTEVTDAPEHRSIPIDTFEVEDGDDNTLTLTGYASTYQPYEMYGGPSNGMGWIEQIGRGAFERTLKEGPDLHLLINHEGLPLARTKSGDLELSADDHGLKVVARLDRSDPDVQRLEPKMRKRAGQTRPLMDEMSFAFRVKSQEWDSTPEFKDDPQALRTITEVSLHKGDVSVVNWGANPTTHAEMKSVSEALRVLAECQPTDLVEARSSDDILRRAKANLANAGVLSAQAFLDGVLPPVVEEVRAANVNDIKTLIASLDAVLDEAIDLIADVDIKALPEKVAQALDLVRGAETLVGKLMDVAGIYDPDNNDDDGATDSYDDDAGRTNPDNTEKRESVSDHLSELAHERSDSDELSAVVQELVGIAQGLREFKEAIAELVKRDDSEELDDDEMCADGDDEEEASEDEEEANSRGMSLSEARSQESTLSLAELFTLE